MLPNLFDQIDGPVDLFLADGAYDGSATRNLLAKRFGASLEIIIPPPKNATFSTNMAQDLTVRDYQIAHIKANGRISWQKAPVTINAVVSRHKWAAGRLSLAPS
ncbi:MAG: hypothetical protein ABJI18_09545 [Lentilitoribacter sp.]